MTTVSTRTPPLQGDFPETATLDIKALTPVPLTVNSNPTVGTFVYSATAEDNVGRSDVTEGGTYDGGAGITFEAPEEASGVLYHVTLRADTSPVDPALEGVVEGELVDFAVAVNSEIVANSEEGPSDLVDAATSYTFNTIVTLQDGDVIRVVPVGTAGVAAENDVAIEEGGYIEIY